MSLFTKSAQGLADRIIGLTGQSLTLTRRAAGTAYDPATGITIAATSATVRGVILPYESFLHMGFRKERGVDVVEGDQVAMISPVGLNGNPIDPPQTNDQITVGTKAYSILSVAPHAPAGVDLLFVCMIRGST